jgi:hypothetical protein
MVAPNERTTRMMADMLRKRIYGRHGSSSTVRRITDSLSDDQLVAAYHENEALKIRVQQSEEK